MTTFEQVKEIAEELVSQAKGFLQKDGWLQSVVFLVLNNNVIETVLMDFSSLEAKDYSFLEVSKLARKRKADVVITIGEGYGKLATKEELDAHTPGSLAEDFEAHECLLMSIKGEYTGTWVKEYPYHRNEVGDIEFSTGDKDFIEARLTPVLDWWKTTKQEKT